MTPVRRNLTAVKPPLTAVTSRLTGNRTSESNSNNTDPPTVQKHNIPSPIKMDSPTSSRIVSPNKGAESCEHYMVQKIQTSVPPQYNQQLTTCRRQIRVLICNTYRSIKLDNYTGDITRIDNCINANKTSKPKTSNKKPNFRRRLRTPYMNIPKNHVNKIMLNNPKKLKITITTTFKIKTRLNKTQNFEYYMTDVLKTKPRDQQPLTVKLYRSNIPHTNTFEYFMTDILKTKPHDQQPLTAVKLKLTAVKLKLTAVKPKLTAVKPKLTDVKHSQRRQIIPHCRNRCKFLNIDSLSHRLVVGLLIKAIQTL